MCLPRMYLRQFRTVLLYRYYSTVLLVVVFYDRKPSHNKSCNIVDHVEPQTCGWWEMNQTPRLRMMDDFPHTRQTENMVKTRSFDLTAAG